MGSSDRESVGRRQSGKTCADQEANLDERVIEYLNTNESEKLAALLRNVDHIGAKALEVLAFMIDGKSEDPKLMKAYHPFRIYFKRWKNSRPPKPVAIHVKKKIAIREVERLVSEGMQAKGAIPLVAAKMGWRVGFVRTAYYPKGGRPKLPQADGR